MASAQVARSSLKRTHQCATALSSTGAVVGAAGVSVKRRCRGPQTVDAALRCDDPAGFTRYSARRAALVNLRASDASLARLLRGLGDDREALRKIVDLNVCAPAVTGLLADYNARSVSLAALNVRVHRFSLAEKETVLANFAAFYSAEQWPKDVASFVACDLFAEDRKITVTVLSGGGVRDVLIADWCAMYNIRGPLVTPHLIVVTGDSGRSFLVPFLPGQQI